jgi:Cu/Ag efflux pump CusA
MIGGIFFTFILVLYIIPSFYILFCRDWINL